jgi:hypothetical protein
VLIPYRTPGRLGFSKDRTTTGNRKVTGVILHLIVHKIADIVGTPGISVRLNALLLGRYAELDRGKVI